MIQKQIADGIIRTHYHCNKCPLPCDYYECTRKEISLPSGCPRWPSLMPDWRKVE